MINVASNNRIKPYKFKDGEKTITCKNPTQELYSRFSSGIDREDVIDITNEIIDSMLYPEDKHYNEDLDISTKIVLMEDYIKFHLEQLESRFPGSDNR